jgi:hypothetical protein
MRRPVRARKKRVAIGGAAKAANELVAFRLVVSHGEDGVVADGKMRSFRPLPRTFTC